MESFRIFKLKEKTTEDGVTFFTGKISYHGKNLSFAYHLREKQLNIFRWELVSRQDRIAISRYIKANLHKGMEVKEYFIPCMG